MLKPPITYMHKDPDSNTTFYWRDIDDLAYKVHLTDDHTYMICRGYREDIKLPANRFNYSTLQVMQELEYNSGSGITAYIQFLLMYEK